MVIYITWIAGVLQVRTEFHRKFMPFNFTLLKNFYSKTSLSSVDSFQDPNRSALLAGLKICWLTHLKKRGNLGTALKNCIWSWGSCSGDPRCVKYSYLPTPSLGQDMTQGHFLSRVWIQSFPSPRLVASPRLKNPVCPPIYP